VTKKCYFTFPTTYQAIRAEKILAKENREYRMVPVPRSISSSCGLALCCLPEDAQVIKDYLKDGSVIVEGFFELEEKASAGPLSFLRKRRS
jgi:hypothetical protein